MSSTAAAVADVLPALPPIRTTAAAAAKPACSSAASSSTAPAPDAESVALPAAAEKKQQQGEAGSEAQDQEREAEAEPRTPTSEESRLRPPVECPPAPRKPAWVRPTTQRPPSTPAKRNFPSSAAPSSRRAFFPVARDLTTVFRALPPKKRIRAG